MDARRGHAMHLRTARTAPDFGARDRQPHLRWPHHIALLGVRTVTPVFAHTSTVQGAGSKLRQGAVSPRFLTSRRPPLKLCPLLDRCG